MASIFFLVLTVCLLLAVPSIRRQMRMNEELGKHELERAATQAEVTKTQKEINERLLARMRKRDAEEAECEEKGFE